LIIFSGVLVRFWLNAVSEDIGWRATFVLAMVRNTIWPKLGQKSCSPTYILGNSIQPKPHQNT
jgi:hypothetical protein